VKVVAPYRPFPPESAAHEQLGPFDWISALKMSALSCERVGCRHYTLTDVDTDLPVPCYKFATRHRRLMLWILEVSLAYLESPAFDEDTLFIGADVLAIKDLSFGFASDLGVVVRTQEKFTDPSVYPILNSAQWWRHSAKDRLASFYASALQNAEGLHENVIRWGADTAALCTLLWPVVAGESSRGCLAVFGHDERTTIVSLASADVWRLENGQGTILPTQPLLDFRYRRKNYMRAWFEKAFGPVPA